MRAIGVSSIALATMVLTATDVRSANNNWCATYTKPKTKTVPLGRSSNAKLRCGDLADGVGPIRSLRRRSGPVGPGANHRAKLPRQLMEATASSQRLDRAPRGV
jgi:hypothetical protein